jgi:hypothetical protein
MNGNHSSMRFLFSSVPILQSSAPDPPAPGKKRRKSKGVVTPAPKPPPKPKGKPYKKKKISAALREQVWIQHSGRVFERKCMVTWCKNTITVFDFQCGHDIPESKGGPTDITNLYPICGKCNLSMSNTYTFQEWCKLYTAMPDELPIPSPLPPPLTRKSWLSRVFSCFS